MELSAHVGDKCKEKQTDHRKILLVDDDESVREVVARILQRSGFQVASARDGREAVEIFRRHHDDIACVLLDIEMPRMDGNQAFEIMVRIRPDVKVLVMSGYNKANTVGAFTQAEPWGFIQKPFPPAELDAKMQELFAEEPRAAYRLPFGQICVEPDAVSEFPFEESLIDMEIMAEKE